jgi:hypothetical protein
MIRRILRAGGCGWAWAAIAVVVATSQVPAARAGQLSNAKISLTDFLAAFSAPVKGDGSKFIDTPFRFNNTEATGAVRSQVFQGTAGVNDNIYAYVFQIVAPGDTQITGFDPLSFAGGSIEATFGKNKYTSVYIGGLGTSKLPLGGFNSLGSIAPDKVEQGEVGESVHFSYSKLKGAPRATWWPSSRRRAR